MLEVYISNKFSYLIKKICNFLHNNPLNNPLQQEIFIVDNKETAQWIEILIANTIGISSNIKFYTPDQFMLKIVQKSLLNYSYSYEYHDPSLFWKFMNLQNSKNFNNTLLYPKFSSIKKVHFASYFSKLFQKYLICRPNYIIEWEKNLRKKNVKNDIKYQGNIWNQIFNSNINKNISKWHFSSLYQRFLNTKIDSKLINSFPPRIIICGMYKIHYSYLILLSKISNFCKTILLFNTPYNISYFIIKDKKKTFQSIFKNLILNKMKQFDYINFIKLNSIKTKKYIFPYQNTSFTLLEKIQENIFNTINKSSKKNNKKCILINDNTVQVHSCYTYRHEIEILYNNLINLLQSNLNIKPRHILIVAKNIQKYVPFIHEFFGINNNTNYIPYIINKTHTSDTNIIFDAFEKILSLSDSTFTIDEIFYYLRLKCIHNKFYFSEHELSLLKQWITEVNIKWGINTKYLKSILIPCKKYNTWEYGINRIFLGYSIGEINKLWNTTLSYNKTDSSLIEIIGKLHQFIHLLNKWRKKIKFSKYLKQWLPLCNEIINDFFSKDHLIFNKKLLIIQHVWKQFINSGITNNYKKKFL